MVLQLQSDARLVSLAREDAPGAFEAIVDRYRGPLVRHCTRLVGRDHAEDVVQQAFMKTYVFLRDDDRELLLRPWLYRVSRNLALNTLDRSDWPSRSGSMAGSVSRISAGRRSRPKMSPSSASTTKRFTVFSSSRTLPRHSYSRKSRMT